MASKTKTIVRSLLSLLLAAVFLYIAFRGTSFSDLWQSLQGAHFVWIVLIVPIALVSHYVRALRWKYLLIHVKQDISTPRLFSAVMIGYMVNNVLPRVGELVRPYVAGKLEGISASTAFGTVVIERIIDMMTFFFLLCIVLFLFPESLSALWADAPDLRPLFLAGSAGSFVLFVLIFFKSESIFRLLRYIRPLIPQRYREKLDSIFESFLSGFTIASTKDKLPLVILLSFAIWFLYGLGLYVPFSALDSIAALNLGLGESMILLTVISVAFVLPAPGAFGTYHSFLKFALIRLYGVDDVTALSYSVITHEVNYILVMVVGIFYFLKDHLKVSEVRLGTTEVGK
jgi:hypothetical protein